LHKAAGNNQKHRPKYWLENQQTQDLIAEIEKGGIPPIQSKQQLGTYVAKELVYADAMWISPAFHLKVIRAYDAMATSPAFNPNGISRLQLLEIALQAEQERVELAGKMGRLESRLDSIEQDTPNGRQIATGKRLYTVQQAVDAYPAFSVGGLRHLIFFSTGKNPNALRPVCGA
jgi:hypothetical protein